MLLEMQMPFRKDRHPQWCSEVVNVKTASVSSLVAKYRLNEVVVGVDRAEVVG